jgi:hypothetical protein
LRLESWLNVHAADTNLARKEPARIGNIDFIVHLDHMVSSLGFGGYTEFCPHRRLGRNGPHQSRYWVDFGSAECMHGCLPLPATRSCINDEAQEKTWYEIPRELVDGTPQAKKHIHMTHDQTPNGWPGLVCLYRDFGVRGNLEPDRYHNEWGGARKAMNQAGLGGLMLITTVCMKAKRAPFGGAGFLGSLSDTMKQYFLVCDYDDDVFQWFYPWICEVFSIIADVNYGTVAHMRMVWVKCQRSDAFDLIGEATKLARWFVWFKGHRESMRPVWPLFAMSVCIYGMYRKWWAGPDMMLETAASLKCRDDAALFEDDGEDDDSAFVDGTEGGAMRNNAEELKV